MTQTPCLHPHGDIIDGYWLCGRCYEKLPERPVKYSKGNRAISVNGAEYFHQIPIYAKIRKASNGWSLSKFVEAMVRRLIAKADFEKSDAISYAIDLLKIQGIEFGSGDYAWDTVAAWDIIYDDMQYWDRDAGGNQ